MDKKELKESGIRIMHRGDKRLYVNEHDYIHCYHNGILIPVTYRWGNTAYVCESCGEVVSKDLMPTSA